MMREAASGRNPASVRAVLAAALEDLAMRLEAASDVSPDDALAVQDIRRWQKRPFDPQELSEPADLPPGSPIGSGRDGS